MKYKAKNSVRLYIPLQKQDEAEQKTGKVQRSPVLVAKVTGKNSFILTPGQYHPWKTWLTFKSFPSLLPLLAVKCK
jgi:hypothetical protein